MDLPDDALVAVLLLAPSLRLLALLFWLRLRLFLLLVTTDVVLLKVNVQLLHCAA